MTVIVGLLRSLTALLLSPLLLAGTRVLRSLLEVRPLPAGVPPGPPRPLPGRPGAVSVVVVSLDGRDLLATSLPPLLAELHADAARHGHAHQVLVVDNGSRDESVAWLAEAFPEIEVLALPRNLGFGDGNNAGLALCRNDHVLLLNNDMLVEPGLLDALRAGFTDDGVFAVTAQVLAEPGSAREETGKTRAGFRRGRLEWAHATLDPGDGCQPVLWAGGGASLYDRHKLHLLGGFDPMYGPAYVEDADLAWRAWKRGWRSLLAPAARAVHRHRSTSARVFSRSYLRALVLGNQWCFALRNLGDAGLLDELFRWWWLQLARDVRVEGVGVTLRALGRVLRNAAAIRRGRRDAARHQRVPDRALLSLDRRFVVPPEAPGSRAPGAPAPAPRVLVACAFLPRYGVHAGGQRMFKLLERLARSYRVTVLAYVETDEEAAAAAELGFCEEVRLVRRGRSPNVPNPFLRVPPVIATEYSNPEMQRALEEAVCSGRFDLVQLEYLQMAHLLPPWSTVPALLTHHEVQSHAMARQCAGLRGLAGLRARLARVHMLAYELRQCRRFDRVLCMTDEDAAALLAYDPSLPLLVHNTGVDTDELRPSPEPEADRLCFVGFYRHRPNADAMLRMADRILPLVRAEVPGVELAIIGAEPPPEVRALAARPGITVTGRVPSIAPPVRDSKVYVVPLEGGVGIRGKVLEAWALGRAVVSTRVGAAGLRCEAGRDLLLADDDEAFAAACVRLLRDAALRRALVEAGLDRVRAGYSWDAKAAEHAAIWDEVLALAGARAARGCGAAGGAAALPWRRTA
ncbi:MAG: glycosyltransferase [Planctomycetota bacterium]